MVDTGTLRVVIKESGLKNKWLADKLGVTEQTFCNKMGGRSQFKADEIRLLATLLRLRAKEVQEIFFADDVAEIATKTEGGE